MTINDLLELIKKESGLTQEQLSEELECTQATISRLLKDSQIPSVQLLQRIVAFAKNYEIKVQIEDILLKKRKTYERSRKVRG